MTDTGGDLLRQAGRVAALSCIHGNLPALEAVLAEIDGLGGDPVDTVVVLGDIATGPMPAETLDLLAGLGDRAVWVHGNADRELLTVFDGGAVPGPNGPPTRASADLIDDRRAHMLRDLPMTVTVEVAGLGPVLLCHATPTRDDGMLLVDSPPAAWEAALSGVTAPVVVCGHTHMPFDRLAAGHRIVNAGSVGMPYGPPGACWALLDASGPQLRRTAYDVDAAADRIAASAYADGAEWAAEYVRTQYSDTEALAAFTAAAEQQRQ